MVNKQAVVKVVDFGIARVLDTSKTQTGMLIGTFAYMSPEQYHGEHADERSDIWSFGVLLYELLCYQRPFTGENPASLMHSICSQEPRSLTERVPDCPPAMEGILAKILRKSRQDRFQSMEDASRAGTGLQRASVTLDFRMVEAEPRTHREERVCAGARPSTRIAESRLSKHASKVAFGEGQHRAEAALGSPKSPTACR